MFDLDRRSNAIYEQSRPIPDVRAWRIRSEERSRSACSDRRDGIVVRKEETGQLGRSNRHGTRASDFANLAQATHSRLKLYAKMTSNVRQLVCENDQNIPICPGIGCVSLIPNMLVIKLEI